MNTYAELNEAQVLSELDGFTEKRYRQFAGSLNPGTHTVLDLGCNTGRGGAVLKRLDPTLELIGLDVVPSRIDRLPKDVYSSAVCGSCVQIDLPDRSVDAIVAGEFIEHLQESDVLLTLRECYRILRPHGSLLLTTPNPGYLKLKLNGHSVLGGPHLSQHYPKDLKLTLQEVGFSEVRIMGSGRMTRLLGAHCPILALYGSYLAKAFRDAGRTLPIGS